MEWLLWGGFTFLALFNRYAFSEPSPVQPMPEGGINVGWTWLTEQTCPNYMPTGGQVDWIWQGWKSVSDCQTNCDENPKCAYIITWEGQCVQYARSASEGDNTCPTPYTWDANGQTKEGWSLWTNSRKWVQLTEQTCRNYMQTGGQVDWIWQGWKSVSDCQTNCDENPKCAYIITWEGQCVQYARSASEGDNTCPTPYTWDANGQTKEGWSLWTNVPRNTNSPTTQPTKSPSSSPTSSPSASSSAPTTAHPSTAPTTAVPTVTNCALLENRGRKCLAEGRMSKYCNLNAKCGHLDSHQPLNCSDGDGKKELEWLQTSSSGDECSKTEFDNDFDKIMSTCSSFCTEATGDLYDFTSVPVVIGSESYGMNLPQAAEVCLNPTLLGSVYTTALKDECEGSAGAIQKIEDATVGFLKQLRQFSYSILHFKGSTLNVIDRVKAQLQSQEVIQEINDARRSEKPDVVLNIYKTELRSQSSSSQILEAAIGELKSNVRHLDTVMGRELDTMVTFTTKCNRFFPKTSNKQFLRGICRKNGPYCIEDNEAEHVSCCCLNNPVANMDFLNANVQFRQRVLADDDEEEEPVTTRDVCAESLVASQSSVNQLKQELEEMGRGNVVVEFEAERKKKYGKTFCGASSKRRLKVGYSANTAINGDDENDDEEENIIEQKEGIDRQLQFSCGDTMAGFCNPDQEFNNANHESCTDDVQSLDIAKLMRESSEEYCCNTDLGICKFGNFEKVMDQCEEFCSEGGGTVSIPVVVGSDAFGLSLEAAAKVCFSPELLSDRVFGQDNKPSNLIEEIEKCEDASAAMENIETAVIAFLKHLREFTYTILLFKGKVQDVVRQIKERLDSREVKSALEQASRSEKGAKIVEIYSDVIEGAGLGGNKNVILTGAIDALKSDVKALKRVMEGALDQLDYFAMKCNTYFPKVSQNEFLLDICTQTGSHCLTDRAQSDIEHVSCCCLNNPVANMDIINTESSLRRELRSVPRSLSDHSNRDVCAEAFSSSEGKVVEVKTQLVEINKTSIYQDYENTLKALYDEGYNPGATGSPSSSSPTAPLSMAPSTAAPSPSPTSSASPSTAAENCLKSCAASEENNKMDAPSQNCLEDCGLNPIISVSIRTSISNICKISKSAAESS